MSEQLYSVYGYCPMCDAPSVSRERRPDGNDHCANGHIYPSKSAAVKPMSSCTAVEIDVEAERLKAEENIPCPNVVLLDTRAANPDPTAFSNHIRVSNGELVIRQYNKQNMHIVRDCIQTVYYPCKTLAALRRWCLALEIPCDNLEVFKT